MKPLDIGARTNYDMFTHRRVITKDQWYGIAVTHIHSTLIERLKRVFGDSFDARVPINERNYKND